MESTFVVVAEPFQNHLQPQEQEVVSVLLEAFLSNWPVAENYEALPVEYMLEHNVSVRVFRKTAPASALVRADTLQRMRQYVKK